MTDGLTTDVALADIVDESQMVFSIATNSSQAIPSALDGLKPSQRTAVWSAFDGGLVADKPHKKTLALVGHAVGNYYPYGDASLVGVVEKLEADYLNNIPLLDGEGSWESCGITAASSRYTSVRLSRASDAACRLIAEGACEMVPSYDGLAEQPKFLPVPYPLALLNPQQGIGVGMATKIPSWNFDEIADAVDARIAKGSELSVEELRKWISGPDFPMGASVYTSDEDLDSLLSSGAGVIVQRATVQAEGLSAVFSNMPVDVTPEKLIAAINRLIEDKKLTSISKVRNATDEVDARLEVTFKRGTNVDIAVEQLYSLTKLQDNFVANANFLVNDTQPRQLGVGELIEEWLTFRFDNVRRVATFRRERFVRQLHLARGLQAIMVDIDRAIAIIRAAKGRSAAQAALSEEFSLDEEQADYILQRRLSSLTATDALELEARIKELSSNIKVQDGILASEQRQAKVILDELDDAVEAFGWDRRSTVLASLPDAVGVEAASGGAPGASGGVSSQSFFVTAEGKGKVSTEMYGALSTPVVDGVGSVIVVSSEGQGIHIDLKNVPTQGGAARGVAIMKLPDGAQVIAVGSSNVRVTTNRGVGIVGADDIPVKGRGGQGVRLVTLRKNETLESVEFTEEAPTMKRGQGVPKS